MLYAKIQSPFPTIIKNKIPKKIPKRPINKAKFVIRTMLFIFRIKIINKYPSRDLFFSIFDFDMHDLMKFFVLFNN
jgi:hypothetical protein